MASRLVLRSGRPYYMLVGGTRRVCRSVTIVLNGVQIWRLDEGGPPDYHWGTHFDTVVNRQVSVMEEACSCRCFRIAEPGAEPIRAPAAEGE